MSEHRRQDDQWYVKLYRLWPIIVSLITVVYFSARVQGKVEDHETRITRLENDMARVRENTDLLVEKLIRK